jgi:hypothetical protein
MIVTLEHWFEDLMQRRSAVVPRTVKVEGIRAAHTGPRLEYGRIVVEARPASVFSAEWSVDVGRGADDEEFIRAAVFGVLDVVLGAEPYPLKNVAVRVLEIEAHEIDSSRMAFRRAGQDAGRKLLNEIGLTRT